jgi:hypothetical protein
MQLGRRSRDRSRVLPVLTLLTLTGLTTGCATLNQFAALQDVAFSLDGVSGVRLAGVDLDRVRSYEDLGFQDVARLVAAVSQNELPLDLTLHVGAENPHDNDTDARLTRMDWTLLLENRETLSGILEDEILLRPGVPQDIPVTVSLNLVDFFEGSAQDLFELGLSLAGQGGAAKEVALRFSPTVNTPLGPMTYPQPITIRRTVGG